MSVMTDSTMKRLLFVHAHPDDEASKGAATAAKYVDAGVRVTLVTFTDGAAGDLLNPNATLGDDPVAVVRSRELAKSVAAIGFAATYTFNERDSGWHEDPYDVPEGTFARADIDTVAAKLAAVIRDERPQVVVTYPENGGYPHPDHIMTYLVSMRALELAETPPGGLAGWRVAKVYAATTFTYERIMALHGALEGDSPFTEWLEKRNDRAFGPPPDTRIHCADWFARRDQALLAHQTQVDPDGIWFAVPRDTERAVYPYEGFYLLRSDVWVEPEETDLFAGLDEAGSSTA